MLGAVGSAEHLSAVLIDGSHGPTTRGFMSPTAMPPTQNL